MKREFGTGTITLLQGDITELTAEAIVTAANRKLEGGGGVDAAVHHAAGPELLESLRPLADCPAGQAVITAAFDLETRGVKYVVHAVGPIWQNGEADEPALLRSAYDASLALAEEHQLSSIAFPAISAGAYGFPLHGAAYAGIESTIAFLRDNPMYTRDIRFVLFDEQSYEAFESALSLSS